MPRAHIFKTPLHVDGPRFVDKESRGRGPALCFAVRADASSGTVGAGAGAIRVWPTLSTCEIRTSFSPISSPAGRADEPICVELEQEVVHARRPALPGSGERRQSLAELSRRSTHLGASALLDVTLRSARPNKAASWSLRRPLLTPSIGA